MALGWLLKRVFRFPSGPFLRYGERNPLPTSDYFLTRSRSKTTDCPPYIGFNNTNALPLLLIQSLETSGLCNDLTMGSGDKSSAAASQAWSCFLASAMVGNSSTFAAGPKLLDNEDPILCSVMILVRTGPPTAKLTALADVSGTDEDEKMSIAKFVTTSYAVSPFICFAVVGPLKAVLAIRAWKGCTTEQ
ncbi:hypothetical protein N431DRAFT_186130 [Stipitochalara longipes BDJ]|nr:hypothetical protein N431DRAFT_186130 [Stipitochalara longipes BDJ]